MAKQVTTFIIDHDIKFIELVKQAISRTDNLIYVGSASKIDNLDALSYKLDPQLVLINIDIEHPGYKEYIKIIRKNIPESFIILMNQDDKKFANYIPEEKVADNFLDKNTLFEEMMKISNSFEQISENKIVKDYS